MFETARELLKLAGERNKPNNPVNARYPFTGKIICGYCGKSFQRKTAKGRVGWLCATYLEHGKSVCPAKQIPETALLDACAEALRLSSFDEIEFRKRISRIEAAGANTLKFVFVDGTICIAVWRDRSRSESWTDEMKQTAREKSLTIKEALNGGSNPEAGNEN